MPGSIKALRLHKLLLGGGLNVAQLEAELGNAIKAGAFEASLRQRTVVGNLKASPSALNVVAGSAIALNAIFRQDMTVLDTILASAGAVIAANTAALGAVIANTTARDKLIASNTSMTQMAASATAMAVLCASSSTMTAIAASAAAMAILAGSATAMSAIAGSATARAATLASSTAMAAIAASSVAKMTCYNSDTFLNEIAASATAMAALRAAAQYSVKTGSANGTTPVALGWVGTYIVLGASRSTTTVNNVTFATVRAGSGISATLAVDAVSDANAMDSNVAIPLSSAASFVLNSGTTGGTFYFGALRCDV